MCNIYASINVDPFLLDFKLQEKGRNLQQKPIKPSLSNRLITEESMQLNTKGWTLNLGLVLRCPLFLEKQQIPPVDFLICIQMKQSVDSFNLKNYC